MNVTIINGTTELFAKSFPIDPRHGKAVHGRKHYTHYIDSYIEGMAGVALDEVDWSAYPDVTAYVRGGEAVETKHINVAAEMEEIRQEEALMVEKAIELTTKRAARQLLEDMGLVIPDSSYNDPWRTNTLIEAARAVASVYDTTYDVDACCIEFTKEYNKLVPGNNHLMGTSDPNKVYMGDLHDTVTGETTPMVGTLLTDEMDLNAFLGIEDDSAEGTIAENNEAFIAEMDEAVQHVDPVVVDTVPQEFLPNNLRAIVIDNAVVVLDENNDVVPIDFTNVTNALQDYAQRIANGIALIKRERVESAQSYDAVRVKYNELANKYNQLTKKYNAHACNTVTHTHSIGNTTSTQRDSKSVTVDHKNLNTPHALLKGNYDGHTFYLPLADRRASQEVLSTQTKSTHCSCGKALSTGEITFSRHLALHYPNSLNNKLTQDFCKECQRHIIINGVPYSKQQRDNGEALLIDMHFKFPNN